MCTQMKKLERQQHSDSGMTSGCNGVPSPSSSVPTSFSAQRAIAQRLRDSPHLLTIKQTRILSAFDQSISHSDEKEAAAQTARLREMAELAMSSCGITPDIAQVQEEDVMCQLEIVRKECEKEGLGFYAGVTMIDYKAVQSEFPEMDLTPVGMSSPSVVEQLNNSILKGKISIDDLSESDVLNGAEWLRSFVLDPQPLLKVCSRVFVLALVLVVHAQKHVPVSGHTSCDTHTNTHSL